MKDITNTSRLSDPTKARKTVTTIAEICTYTRMMGERLEDDPPEADNPTVFTADTATRLTNVNSELAKWMSKMEEISSTLPPLAGWIVQTMASDTTIRKRSQRVEEEDSLLVLPEKSATDPAITRIAAWMGIFVRDVRKRATRHKTGRTPRSFRKIRKADTGNDSQKRENDNENDR